MRPRGCVFVPQVLRPKAGWYVNYPSGNSSACGMSRVHKHPQMLRDRSTALRDLVKLPRCFWHSRTSPFDVSDEFLYRERQVTSDRQGERVRPIHCQQTRHSIVLNPNGPGD
ncbi:MAG: hypothetical protein QOJ20_1279 [Mycobacterium sp.]|nr:hypothetical protein [Mycobacterium sp.]